MITTVHYVFKCMTEIPVRKDFPKVVKSAEPDVYNCGREICASLTGTNRKRKKFFVIKVI